MLPSLLTKEEIPIIDGVKIPEDLYIVLNDQLLLAGMSYPSVFTPWKEMNEAGFSNIVCLANSKVNYDPSPLKVIFSEELEDLFWGYNPRNPKREERLIRQAVKMIRRKLDEEEGIVVHCVGGTGRTGTVIGCVLKNLGYSADEVINYLNELNKERHYGKRPKTERPKNVWPEAAWQGKMIKKY